MDYLDSDVFKQYLDSDSIKNIDRKEVFESDNKEVKVFDNLVRIDARQFKTALSDIEALLKKSTNGSAVVFKVAKGKLEIRCMNKIFYKAIFDIDGKCNDCEITTIYRPIEKSIAEEGSVDIRLNPSGVEVKTNISEISILPNIATVIDVDVNNYGYVAFNHNLVLNGLKNLLSTTAIINKLGTAVNINMKDKYMNCKYATSYIQCPCDRINNSITHDMGRVLYNFLNSGGICFISQGVNNQIFKKDNRYMALPVNDIPVTNIRQLLETAEDFGNVHHRGFYENVKQSVQSFGPGVGTVDFYRNGATITRTTEGCRIRIDCGNKDEFLFTRILNLDFLRDVLSIAGSSYKLYKRGDYACLETVDNCILII